MTSPTYTAGELARMAGISSRMLRHYDKIGLLHPMARSEGGYRLYDEDSLIRLQKIIMLRYLDFSLEQIGLLLESDSDQRLTESLAQQAMLLSAQKRRIDRILEALTLAGQRAADGHVWDALSGVISLTANRQAVLNHYATTLRRQRVSRIHTLYSQNPYGWFRWLFERFALRPGDRVAGCYALGGDIWPENADRIPECVSLELFDMAESNLEETRSGLSDRPLPRGVAFRFTLWDGTDVPLEPDRYDLIIAGQLFIQGHDLPGFFARLHRALKPGGRLICVTMGQHHMEELTRIGQAFEPSLINYNSEFNRRFSLETGGELIRSIFGNATVHIYPDHLMVDDAGVICDYLYGAYTNAGVVMKHRRPELQAYVEDLLTRGPLYVTKSQGLIEARKAADAP